MKAKRYCKTDRITASLCSLILGATLLLCGCARQKGPEQTVVIPKGSQVVPADGVWHGLAKPSTARQVVVEAQFRAWERDMQNPFVPQGGPKPVDPQWRHEFDTLESKYSVQTEQGTLKASDALPDHSGSIAKAAKQGVIKVIPILMPGQTEGTLKPVLNGSVWTPRVVSIGDLDLSINGPVTTLPEFNFDDFKRNPAVIPFKNGYAVNLFGAKVWDGFICQYQARENYKTQDGRNLPGRLVLKIGGGFREYVLAPGSGDLVKLPRVR